MRGPAGEPAPARSPPGSAPREPPKSRAAIRRFPLAKMGYSAAMTGILVVATLTLAASFLCSLLEAVLYKITPSQVALLRKRGGKGIERLAKAREEIEEPIAAILTINTIAHTVGSAWCGAMVGEHYGSAAVGFFAGVFTFLVLVVTEIIPKSLGVRFATVLAPWIAWPLQVMIWIAWPVARPAKAAMRLFTGAGEPEVPTEEEVLLFSQIAARHGSVRPQEHEWLQNALRLDRVLAKDLRTPRMVVESFPAEMSIEEAGHLSKRWVHSRAPIYEEGDAEKVTGLVFRREVSDAALAGREGTLADLSHALRFVPESMPAHTLLDLFITERRHMVALIDEYGGFEGVVTLEDVLECLLGAEIVDEHDEIEDMQEHARRANPHADG